MYSVRQLRRGLADPQRAFHELWRLYNRRLRGRTGIDVVEADWDTLVILDACRYDLFADVNDIEGDLRSVISQGSNTAEFLTKNFDDGPYLDTVYVSANPQTRYNDIDGEFVHTERLWEDAWDDELNTVRPEVVTEHALRVHDEYPDKRVIVHYVQPHYPFIGETGRNIEHGSVVEIGTDGEQREEREADSIWDQLERGDIDSDTVRRAYRENLDLALPEVQRLIDGLDGRVVVTSDHGNVFGRFGVHGHPGNTYLQALVRVPWLVVEGERRRRITAAEEVGPEPDETDILAERLQSLGYAE